MKKKMTMVTLLAVATVAIVAHGDILLDGGSNVSGSLIGADSSTDIRDSYALTDSGSAVSLAIGETFDMEFTLQTVAVGTTTDGQKIGYSNPAVPGWELNNSLKFGFGDGAQAFGVMFDLIDFNSKIELGGDAAATSAGNFNVNTGTSGEITTSLIRTTENELRYVGDTATFNVSVTHTALSTFDMAVTWGDETFNHTLTGVELSSVSDFYVAINDLDVDLGYEVTVIPEPATLGLLGMIGVGLVSIRRIFTI